MENKKFIFVTGPSESGKSGGINYIIDNYSENIKHLKIRNIFPEVYKEANSELEFQEWYDYEYEHNFEQFWDNYIKKASEMSGDKDVVIMDTMYGLKSIQYLYSKLGDNLGVLYIDADLENRIMREYTRLRTDSVRSSRKADLTVTIEDVTKKTMEKDKAKRKKETFEYKDLVYGEGGIVVGNRKVEESFSYVIENNGTEEELYRSLDEYVIKVLLSNKEKKLIKK